MSVAAAAIMIGEGFQWNWEVYQLTFERWVDLYSMKKQVMDIQGSQNRNKNIFKRIKMVSYISLLLWNRCKKTGIKKLLLTLAWTSGYSNNVFLQVKRKKLCWHNILTFGILFS